MNVALKKAQVLARSIVESEEVRASLQRRLAAGQLSEDLELLLFQLAYPPTRHVVRPVVRHTPTLAFPISDDEREAQRTAAALAGDVARVAALKEE